jgi:recombinational DNA repair ATPase RecF
MGSAREDYEHFVRWLHQPDKRVREDVLRFANMVLGDFEPAAATFRQHNSRSHHLAALARRVLAATAPAAPAAAAEVPAPPRPWRRLRQLSVGPFRGFRRDEVFDLQKRVLLFYGPNGSGKSSLCEALEHALLGSVHEAESRRVEAQQYLTNIHARRFAAPRLTATDNNNQEVLVVANPETYRFCFVERNRIEAFARMAARPRVARAELIATLFGMERFSDFVSHFNDSMDAALVCDAANERLLTSRRQALARDQQMDVGEQASLLSLAQAEAALAERCRPGNSYAEVKAWIGTPEQPGRLQELDGILNAIPIAALGLTREQLANRYAATDTAADQLARATEALQARSHQVSFKDLYTGVLALQPSHRDRCPACDTALNIVSTDPYEKARIGLQDLRDLAALEQDVKRYGEQLKEASRSLRADLDTVLASLSQQEHGTTPVGRYLSALDPTPRADRWWQDVYAPAVDGNQDGQPSLALVLDVAARIEARDQETRRQLQERRGLIQERDRLLAWQRQILERDLMRRSADDEIAAARGRIARFDADNAHLIQLAADERENIARDNPIKAAYEAFLILLRRFRNELPGMLMAGLNDLARDLYNEFNHQDPEVDKLASLHLPLRGEERIEIAFRGDPQRRLDALALLSEGHIRCLGLAILLAKAVNNACPLIVFDDAINAIDHDHRSGIRQTIFQSERFRAVQLIVTCHSGEFIKDIHNGLPEHSRNDWAEYVIRHHGGDHHPRVAPNAMSRNYVDRARAAKDALDDREALATGRRALELLAAKIWKWLIALNRGDLRLELAGPGAEPSLRDLCDALRAKIDDNTFAHPEKNEVLASLRLILGIPAQNLIWMYLNKGTHEQEDRDDFDAALVETVVVTLERLRDAPLRRAA